MKLTHSFSLPLLQQRLLGSPIRFLLIPFSWFYGASVWIRNRFYELGVFKARRLPCQVISVGNIVVGGTGKTPAVIAIAKHLEKEKMRVAILLRGYKRQSREKVTIVSDGETVCASLRESGDEAYMMARHLSGIPIVVSRQRYQAGQVALERLGVDILLLDDGFQHRQLTRDIDIVTVPAHSVVGLQAAPEYPFGNRARLLPAGSLREPPTSLRRANIILLTHTDATDILLAKEVLKRLAPNALVLGERPPTRTSLSISIPKKRGENRFPPRFGSTYRKTDPRSLWDRESRWICHNPHAVFSRKCGIVSVSRSSRLYRGRLREGIHCISSCAGGSDCHNTKR